MVFVLRMGNCYALEKTGERPYQHRFDLPGGSQELGEGLTETLERGSRRDGLYA